MNDLANMVLRYYIGFEKTNERFDMLVNFLERTGIKRVILFRLLLWKETRSFPRNIIKNMRKC